MLKKLIYKIKYITFFKNKSKKLIITIFSINFKL
jgi:hypothetical protein